MGLFGKAGKFFEDAQKRVDDANELLSGNLRKRNEELQHEVDELRQSMTPEMLDEVETKRRLVELKAEIGALAKNANELAAEKKRLAGQIAEMNGQLATFDDKLLVQDYGLYEPRFDFASSSQYKNALAECRARQREQVKAFDAKASGSVWTVNNSVAKGRKFVRDISKLIMRAYNGECDEIVRKVKATNVEKSIEQVYKAAASVNRLGATVSISIPHEYQELKEEEVRLAYEFALQKEREKEELREAREQEREARKLEREIAAERKRLEKERSQYLTAYKEISARLKSAGEDEVADLQAKATELRAKLDDVERAVKDVDYREANQRAGYVYVISNIGSFGEGVYKIGMTRRLDPMDRIRELGDASVPFAFDVHALIFCDDAPRLEAALHRKFEDRKVNIVNQRREFFHVSLEEIEEVVKENYDKTVEFSEVPEAEQYRTSEKLREKGIFSARD